MKSHALLFAALFAATPALSAQEEKKPPAGAEMPDPKQEQHEALKALVGTWDCVMKSEAIPGVPGMEEPTESKGTERAELICNGLWLKSIVNATCNGQPFQGIWIAGYDPVEKSYVGVWVCSDEQQGGASTFQGSYDGESRTWTWTGSTPHGEMRSTYVLADADRTLETCYIKTPDGEEVKCMEITRKRSRSPVLAEASTKLTENLTEEQEALLKDVGNWEATVKTTAPGQEPTEDKATERITAICNGRWLWSDFSGEFEGTPFQGHALFGFDPSEEKYVSFWFDSMSPAFAKTSGTYDAGKKAYTLEGTSVDPAGNPVTLEQVITRRDDNTRVLQMEFTSQDQTSKMEIVYKRKTER